MSQVTFYQLSDEDDAGPRKASTLVADAYSNKRKCVVLCASKSEAEAVDELLWQLPANRFVPHNMAGEGPPSGTPVEVCWQASQLGRRQVLVNLSGAMVQNSSQFQQIFDFVPVAEEAKKAARIRYKQFQQAGCQMQFMSA